MDRKRFRFSRANRDDLRRQGVLDEQIRQLEPLLPVFFAILNAQVTAPPLADVRAELDTPIQSLMAAIEGLNRLRSTKPANAAVSEAHSRTLGGLFEHDLDAVELSKLIDDMRRMLTVLQTARTPLDKGQRYHRTADPQPIALIDQAMTRGWGEKYYPYRDRDVDETGPICEQPCYPFSPSRGTANFFYRVVEICYHAISPDKPVNPERAIREYCEQRRAAMDRQSRKLGIV